MTDTNTQIGDLRKSLTKRSILWRAVLHTLLIWLVTLSAITLIAFLASRWFINQQMEWSFRALSPDGVTYEQLAQAKEYAYLVSVQFTRLLLGVGILLLFVAFGLSYSFAKALTRPLFEIIEKTHQLHPGKWTYEKTVSSGDEVELLDVAVADMAGRLEQLYADLEGKVVDRTNMLVHEQNKDKTIVEAMSIGVMVLDSEGLVLEANDSAAKIIKRTVSELVGVRATQLLNIQSSRKPVADEKNPIMRTLNTGDTVVSDTEDRHSISCRDGSHVAVRIHSSPIMEGKNIGGAVIVFEDVTTQRQLDYMKNEFITLASHQLRTPLASMQWYLELLSSEDSSNLSEEQLSFVSELRTASRRMSAIMTGLMDASRLQNGVVQTIPETVDLCQIVDNLSEDIELMAKDKSISCEVSKPDCPLNVVTDPLLFNVVLQNLMSNAVKYSKKEGEIHITLSQDDTKATISIADNGIGIPHADQSRIFEKLFRAHNSRRLEVNGSGLGLYSSKMIMDNLGGTISFESVEDQGSTFTVTIPNKPQKKAENS